MLVGITNAVRKLIEKTGTCDPFRICKELNIIVVKQSLGSETRGLIRKYKRSYIICINSDMDEFHQLRTCCHELGHYVLHKNINTLFLRTCTYLKIDKHEMEAEAFADTMMNELFKNI